MHRTIYTLLSLLFISSSIAQAEDRFLFKFDETGSTKAWQAVNDGVMGGRSNGRFKINQDKHLEFFGTLSLENNGGFASVRASSAKLGLNQGETVVLRVRGDGRKYTFNLYQQRNLGGYSFRQSFKTKKDEWIEVEFQVDKFTATWRGRMYPNEKLNPQRVGGLGILLGDKKPGSFKLEVEWIKAKPASSQVLAVAGDSGSPDEN